METNKKRWPEWRQESTLMIVASATQHDNRAAKRAEWIRGQMSDAAFQSETPWHISPGPFSVGADVAKDLETLGRLLLQFLKAASLLYRQSVAGNQPAWVAEWLDRGKPAELIAWQRHNTFKSDVPRVIRPELLLTGEGLVLSELNTAPIGIGLTAWLNQTYAALPLHEDRSGERQFAHNISAPSRPAATPSKPASEIPGLIPSAGGPVIGGATGMLEGFRGIFDEAQRVHLVISPHMSLCQHEMEWLCAQLGVDRFAVRSPDFNDFRPGDAVYRIFELYEISRVPAAERVFQLAAEKKLFLTPPPKSLLEERMLLALLWNRHLEDFWRRELGEGFFRRLKEMAPYTWVLDPTPLPPHAALAELEITDWRQLKQWPERHREWVIKISGFSELASRSTDERGVWPGRDLSQTDWDQVLDKALAASAYSPYVLQRLHKPKQVEGQWYDFARKELVRTSGPARLCPAYFVSGKGDAARARLGGVMASIESVASPANGGASHTILAPCCV